MTNINCPTHREYEFWFSGEKEKAIKIYINNSFRWVVTYDKFGNTIKIKPSKKEARHSFEYWQTVPSIFNRRIKPVLLKTTYKKIAKLIGEE